MRWARWLGREARRFFLYLVAVLATLGYYLLVGNAVEYGIRAQFGLTHRQAFPYAVCVGLMVTIVSVMVLLLLAHKLGWMKTTMPRHAILNCTIQDPNEKIREGWYIAEIDGKRTMVEVVSDNWGLTIQTKTQDWPVDKPNLPVRLIARADLDALQVNASERERLQAEIGAIASMLDERTKEDDPVGFRQFTDRREDLKRQLAEIEKA